MIEWKEKTEKINGFQRTIVYSDAGAIQIILDFDEPKTLEYARGVIPFVAAPRKPAARESGIKTSKLKTGTIK